MKSNQGYQRYCGFQSIPQELRFGMHPYPARVQYVRVRVQCEKIQPAVYPCSTLLTPAPTLNTSSHSHTSAAVWIGINTAELRIHTDITGFSHVIGQHGRFGLIAVLLSHCSSKVNQHGQKHDNVNGESLWFSPSEKWLELEWVGLLKFSSVQFSRVFDWTANQNRMAGRGCIELQTGPAELGLNLVQTELNLQFFIDVLSGKKECREVHTSVCYVGKHARGTCQVRNACLVVVFILTPAWHWWCKHFRAGLCTAYHICKLFSTHKWLQHLYWGHSINHGQAWWPHTINLQLFTAIFTSWNDC